MSTIGPRSVKSDGLSTGTCCVFHTARCFAVSPLRPARIGRRDTITTKSGTDKSLSIIHKAVTDQCIADKSIADKSVIDKLVTDKSSIKKSVTQKQEAA